MPTDSPNLGLKYYDTTTDSHNKFLTFRSDMAGPLTSNMSKIDAWAGNTNSKIQKLEDSVSGVVLNAQFKSTGYYEAVSPLISTYKVGQAVIVKPDTTTDGSTMLKVNALDVKALMKYSATGELINLDAKDLKINHEYLFRYEGSVWVWQTATSGDQINIVGISDNILVVSADGSIIDSGVPKSAIQDNANAIALLQTSKADKTQVLTDINTHNEALDSHEDIRSLIENIDVSADIEEHNTSDQAHADIRDIMGELASLTTDEKANLVAAINEVKTQSNEKANKNIENWIELELINGWTGSFKVRKNDIGTNEVTFNMTAGVVAPNTLIGTVPSSIYHPNAGLVFHAAYGGLFSHEITMTWDGNLIFRKADGGIPTGAKNIQGKFIY